MSALAAGIAVVLLALLTGLQLGVASGLPWGRLVWGGRHRLLPTRLRIASGLSTGLYVLMAWLLLARAGVLPGGSTPLAIVATWVLLGYFTLGIVMNLSSRSPAERWTMAPTCTVLAAMTLVVAAG